MARKTYSILLGLILIGCGSSPPASGDESPDEEARLQGQALDCTSSPEDNANDGDTEDAYVDLGFSPNGEAHTLSMEARLLKMGQPTTEMDGLVRGEDVALSVSDGAIELTHEGWTLRVTELEDVDGAFVGTLKRPDGVETDASCWMEELAPRYQYDPSTGECRDGNGELGLNAGYNASLVRGTDAAHCADLKGLGLHDNGGNYWTNRNVDLRGADLSGASLSFAEIEDSQLQGAVLGEFEIGYAYLEGEVDEHTVLPSFVNGTSCLVEDGVLSCRR